MARRQILNPIAYGVAFDKTVTLKPGDGTIVWAQFDDGYPPNLLTEFVRAIEKAPDENEEEARLAHKRRKSEEEALVARVRELGAEVNRLQRLRDALARIDQPAEAVLRPPRRPWPDAYDAA